MSSLLKISDAGSIALHAAVFLASRTDSVCPAGEIAGSLRVPETHLVKVLQRLTKAGLVIPHRGPRGGFSLARKPEAITLQKVFEAIEGKLAPIQCLLKHKICNGNNCLLGTMIRTVNEKTHGYLATTSVADLADLFKTTKKERKA